MCMLHCLTLHLVFWPGKHAMLSRAINDLRWPCLLWHTSIHYLLVQGVEASTLNRWGHTTTLYGNKLVAFGG